jgi:hypothetical protein
MSEPVLPSPKSFKSTILIIVTLTIGLAVGAVGGYLLRDAIARASDQPKESVTSIESRNAVWRVWNGEAKSVGNIPEKKLAIAIATIVAPDKQVEIRAMAFAHLLEKSIIFLNTEEREDVHQAISAGSPRDRIRALRLLNDSDRQAGDLLARIFADEKRMSLFLEGKKIPLEQETTSEKTH